MTSPKPTRPRFTPLPDTSRHIPSDAAYAPPGPRLVEFAPIAAVYDKSLRMGVKRLYGPTALPTLPTYLIGPQGLICCLAGVTLDLSQAEVIGSSRQRGRYAVIRTIGGQHPSSILWEEVSRHTRGPDLAEALGAALVAARDAGFHAPAPLILDETAFPPAS